MRTCRTCNQEKPLSEFKATRGNKQTWVCRTCVRRRDIGYKFKAKYGITWEEYDRLLEDQGGRCAICKCKPKKYRLCVDHNHKTGEVRGLLCATCNGKLGYLEDRVWMTRALEYLNMNPSKVHLPD